VVPNTTPSSRAHERLLLARAVVVMVPNTTPSSRAHERLLLARAVVVIILGLRRGNIPGALPGAHPAAARAQHGAQPAQLGAQLGAWAVVCAAAHRAIWSACMLTGGRRRALMVLGWLAARL